MQLLFMKDQYVVQTLSPNTPQKAFTDRIGSWRLIRCFQYLDAARYCNTSETGPKLAIIIADEVLRRVSIRSRLLQLLCEPRVGRRPCHTHVDHSLRDLSSIRKNAKSERKNRSVTCKKSQAHASFA
jgi:hypothetical protein